MELDVLCDCMTDTRKLILHNNFNCSRYHLNARIICVAYVYYEVSELSKSLSEILLQSNYASSVAWIFRQQSKKRKQNNNNNNTFCLIISIEQVSWNNLTNLLLVESNPLTFFLISCICICVHFNCFKLIMSLNYIKSVLHERENTTHEWICWWWEWENR